MEKITIVNLKCEGCRNSIINSLSSAGLRNVDVDIQTNEVSFEGDRNEAKTILEKMGYPELGSEKAKNLIKKVKSYVSCARGKMKN